MFFNNNSTSTQPSNKKRKTSWQPTVVHVEKTDAAYSIYVDVPGVKQEDMQMQLKDKNETLVLSGVRKFAGEQVEEAKFEKRFHIGSDVDVEKITADLSDGVLKITASKKEATAPVIIPIKIGQKSS